MTRVIDTDTNCTPHLDDLKTHGVEVIGRYYAARGSKRLTKTEAQAISDAGLQVFIVYEDSGDPELSIDRGRHDAQIALSQARTIGQPEGSAIYFAMEHLPHGYDASHIPGIKLYFEGIRRTFGGTYKVGCYGNGSALEALLDAKLIDYAWVSASTSFHGSHEFLKSDRWVLAQHQVDKNWGGVSTDTNDAKSDFGAFALPPTPEAASAVAGTAGSVAATVTADEALAVPTRAVVAPVAEEAKPRRDLDYLNEMIEKASRLATHAKNAWTAIKLALGITAGGTGAVTVAAQSGLLDPNARGAGIATSWGGQHPWFMMLIGMTLILIVLGGIMAFFLPKIINGIVSAYKDGRYQPPAAVKPAGV